MTKDEFNTPSTKEVIPPPLLGRRDPFLDDDEDDGGTMVKALGNIQDMLADLQDAPSTPVSSGRGKQSSTVGLDSLAGDTSAPKYKKTDGPQGGKDEIVTGLKFLERRDIQAMCCGRIGNGGKICTKLEQECTIAAHATKHEVHPDTLYILAPNGEAMLSSPKLTRTQLLKSDDLSHIMSLTKPLDVWRTFFEERIEWSKTSPPSTFLRSSSPSASFSTQVLFFSSFSTIDITRQGQRRKTFTSTTSSLNKLKP
ncbi:MAG: hypothetical protein AAF587_44755 [Bacteroidota bacterium]